MEQSTWAQLIDLFSIIFTGMEDQFKKYDREIDSGSSPYDYGSIMHYHDTAFSKNGQKTILLKKNTNVQIGQRVAMSKLDVEQMNTLYKCKRGKYVMLCLTVS